MFECARLGADRSHSSRSREPARLPPGGGTAVLNFIAARAAAQGAGPSPIAAPIRPSSSFWRSSSRSVTSRQAADPLADFMAGGLTWTAGARRACCSSADDLYVQGRDRIEKVVVARHHLLPAGVAGRRAPLAAPDRRRARRRAVRALGSLTAARGRVSCSAPTAISRRSSRSSRHAAASRPLPDRVWAGVAAVVAARVRRAAGALRGIGRRERSRSSGARSRGTWCRSVEAACESPSGSARRSRPGWRRRRRGRPRGARAGRDRGDGCARGRRAPRARPGRDPHALRRPSRRRAGPTQRRPASGAARNAARDITAAVEAPAGRRRGAEAQRVALKMIQTLKAMNAATESVESPT